MSNLMAHTDYSLSDQEVDTQRFSTNIDDDVIIVQNIFQSTFK